jgi:hypothetical protein
MARVRIRYYRPPRNGAEGPGFWEPGKQADTFNLPRSVPCGPDGPAAWAIAQSWNTKLDAARRGEDQPTAVYPKGTFGSFWEKFRRTPSWDAMAPRTREDYWRAWTVIEPRFARCLVTRITAIESERFHLEIHPVHADPKKRTALSWAEAWRVLKCWRAVINALEHYGVLARAPIGRISNPAPPGRTQRWSDGEVRTLINGAWLRGHHGMACAIAIAWDTLFSPVDVRLTVAAEWSSDATGAFIATSRVKTGKTVFAPLSARTALLVEGYKAKLGVALVPTALLLRTRSGQPWATKDTFAQEFRRLRAEVLPGDQRQFLDLRRSGNTEAWVGGEDRTNLAKALGNSLHKNDRLWETYTPPTLAAAREVMAARLIGRVRLASGGSR